MLKKIKCFLGMHALVVESCPVTHATIKRCGNCHYGNKNQEHRMRFN